MILWKTMEKASCTTMGLLCEIVYKCSFFFKACDIDMFAVIIKYRNWNIVKIYVDIIEILRKQIMTNSTKMV